MLSVLRVTLSAVCMCAAGAAGGAGAGGDGAFGRDFRGQHIFGAFVNLSGGIMVLYLMSQLSPWLAVLPWTWNLSLTLLI